MKYQECNKIVKQKAFERAIASDEIKKSVVDSLDIENMSKFSVLLDEYMNKNIYNHISHDWTGNRKTGTNDNKIHQCSYCLNHWILYCTCRVLI